MDKPCSAAVLTPFYNRTSLRGIDANLKLGQAYYITSMLKQV